MTGLAAGVVTFVLGPEWVEPVFTTVRHWRSRFAFARHVLAHPVPWARYGYVKTRSVVRWFRGRTPFD